MPTGADARCLGVCDEQRVACRSSNVLYSTVHTVPYMELKEAPAPPMHVYNWPWWSEQMLLLPLATDRQT